MLPLITSLIHTASLRSRYDDDSKATTMPLFFKSAQDALYEIAKQFYLEIFEIFIIHGNYLFRIDFLCMMNRHFRTFGFSFGCRS
jgi:hypothetical protein